MRILLILALFHCVLAQTGFGTSYLRNSRLCHQWNCLNVKLGLPDSLPPREQYSNVLNSLLPAEWHQLGNAALDVCYGNRTRRYTNTCPGQALMHCVVDNLITNCREDKWQKEDGCNPVSSIAASKYMFSQSRYRDLQKNIAVERRPAWFLQHYFNSKCCEVPQLFNATVLGECGFDSFLLYHTHDAQTDSHLIIDRTSGRSTSRLRASVSRNIPMGRGTPSTTGFSGLEENEAVNDPLDCCDVREFIDPEWRSECGFQVAWNGQERLIIKEGLHPVTEHPATTETVKNEKLDVKIVPLSCEQETCIFKKLGVVSESDAVDSLAFSRLLDTITKDGRWIKAKARVDTKCLSRPSGYEGECEINRVLACTLDILSENCPDAKKEDPCKHSSGSQNNMTCQISSSKFRPHNRRQFCNIPDFVDLKILKECGVESLVKLEHAAATSTTKRGWWDGRKCKEETASTTCIMRKMDVLNKYNFIDYFKMKDRLRHFCQGPWYPMKSTYTAAYNALPLYRGQCGSPQKLLNVLDTILATCPISKRRRGTNCRKMFTELSTSLPGYHQNISDATLEELLGRFQHVFLPGMAPHLSTASVRTVDNPRYNFNFGILNSGDEPLVRVIDVKPSPLPMLEQKPLVLLPVYQRMKNQRPFNNDGIWRSSPVN